MDHRSPDGRHGAAFGGGAEYSPDAVAASLGRGDGGFGREQTTYYEFPALRKAHWGWEIATYFFVGGLMNGSGAMAGIADLVAPGKYPELVRYGRYTALVGAMASGALLVKDLGRPERFLNMLRILKLKSPMSVGVWSVMAISMSAGLNVIDQLERDAHVPAALQRPARVALAIVPRPLRDAMLAITSATTATYVGVLLSATAIPVWYEGRRFIPPLFVLSTATTACAFQAALLSLRGGCDGTVTKLETIETVASIGELALLFAYERSAGDVGKTLFAGETGRRLKRWTMIGGLLVPLALQLPGHFRRGTHKTDAARAVAGALFALAGGWVLRDSMLRAGRASADDPRPVLHKVG